jgi:3-oxoacyl-[acyl-carrier-protein] synthase II
MTCRVYIHGAGAITPLGASWQESLAALVRGESAVAQVERFDVTGFPSTVAAAVDADLGDGEDRRLLLARDAMRQAADMCGEPLTPDKKIGVFIGAESGRATLETVLALSKAAGGGSRFDHEAFGQNAPSFAASFDTSVISPATVASTLSGQYGAGQFGARGPVRTISLACASGSAAVAEAYRAIQAGRCEVAICGGVGADVDPLMLAGFGLLGALSRRGVSRPFDLKRDGFVVGEGAAMFVLSTEPDGAIAEIVGAGRTLDAHHLTKPAPDGDGAKRAMRQALAEAGLAFVDYVQAHGTSTLLNDAVEAQALVDLMGAEVMGDALARSSVSSVKGAVGHWIAGAGAIGLLCAVEAVKSGLVLPTAGLENVDRDCQLPHVIGEAIERPVDTAMVNSFAFGGANCSLVVRRCD